MEASPDLCEKWTRATGLWAVPVKEASSSESGNVECGFNDWKRKGVGGSDGEEEGGSVVCAGNPVEGEQARELGGDCKLFYSGADEGGRNGVGIVLSKEFKDSLVSVSRTNDRVMSVKLGIGETVVNVICAYAPQVGCEDEEKETFWRQMDQELRAIPEGERVIVGGDLNGHVGISREAIERIHGGWGVGEKNEEGERVTDFAMAFDLSIVITFFEKRPKHLVTYKSGGRQSQIDFLMCRRQQLNEVKNCKVINGESVAAQHRVLVLDWEIKCSKRRIPEKVTPKIKWWRLKEENLKIQFREKVLSERRLLENVQDWWEANSTVIVRAGQEVLGMTTGRRPPGDKETWWWNDEVKDAIRAKKEAKKKWDASGRQEERDIYRQANKEAKKEVARSKAHAMDEVYKELETPEGERKIYRIAKARDKSAKDFTQIRQIKDEQGVVLWEHDKIIERWKGYYGNLLNEENPRTVFGDGVPNEGLTPAINRKEVEVALKGMKLGKAMGPDGIPMEVWKSLGEEGVDMLLDLLQKIFEQEKMPEEWRDSVIVPIFKEKGDIQDCGNYRGIKMISHTMKIWERVIDRRLREETTIGEEQFGFMPGRGTTDAIFAARQVIEKHREMQKELHLVFIDLEKAYDRVPRQEVWRCLREQGVPEKYVRLVKDTYEDARTQVKTSIGLTGKITVRVGLHQGSSLSPYLFDMILDVMGRGIKEQPPWCMLFADDILLCSTRRDHVERKLEEWRTAMEERGLKISRRKTEYLGCNEHQDAEIQLQGEPLKRVKTFTYLGSTLAEDGELDAEVTHRVQSGWKNWKRVSGVLCDRRMIMKIKGKVYRTVVRPALMYGAETWALKKAQEKKLEVAEMRMLRWMCGVTKLDKIRNERIRGTTKVGEITKKVQERRLKWYGHVMRREEHYVGRRAMVMQVQGRRKRGRPKRRWLDKVKDDIKEKGLSADDVYDRATWRRMSSYIDPT